MVKRKGSIMSYKIVVMSCDKNKDLFDPFHHCMEKYWKDHPEIIYCCETIDNPYYKTIHSNYPIEQWTKRVYECVKDLPCKHILLTIDDLFLRDYVDNDFIWSLCDYVKDDIASLNFEFSFDEQDKKINDIIMLRNPKGKFKLSCMCQMWQKRAILDLFNVELDPWKFEKMNKAKNWLFLISKNGDFLNWGKKRDDWHWGVVRGKWTKETKEFFDKEGIEIDYSIRDFVD